jgi:hypothetical protein
MQLNFQRLTRHGLRFGLFDRRWTITRVSWVVGRLAGSDDPAGDAAMASFHACASDRNPDALRRW